MKHRCGGTLVLIPDPPWFRRPATTRLRRAVFMRCDKCDLRGELGFRKVDK